ncbi:MAG: molybdopterin-dependent oxidoreductase [Thermincola sp.]|jgi:anaerobic selenocysteine-containing dehydrogenase|nr:molybdopterin-dependent oxidoreductase [Thermincola sp.]MDT3701429.1 molybdopterin-dependent oxidoreductase [Thermincola sp.]
MTKETITKQIIANEMIMLTVNGKLYELDVEPNMTLAEVLREKLKFSRTKEGCGVGECGSCAVLINKKAVASCLVMAVDADGSNIVTVEGMADDSEFSPMQEVFVDRLAIQARRSDSDLTARQEYLTFCHICCGHCAVKVTVAGGIVVDMAPDPESGLPNEMCVVKKGRLSIPEIHTHPDRLKYPLKRVGARGEGKWERVSWDEALDAIAGKLKEIKEKYGPEHLVVGLGEPKGLEFAFGERFATAFGTPNVVTPGWICGVNFGLASSMTFGGFPVPDEENTPKLLVLWGVNSNHTTGGLRRETITHALESGAKLIVIDPRKTDLASQADLWIKVRPGADGSLALGVLKAIVEEKLYDNNFVHNWTIGFECLEESLQTFSFADVEKAAWVPEEQIRRFARLIGRYGPACLQWGNALDQVVNSLQLHRALAILVAITGSVEVPGGLIIPKPEQNYIRPAKFMRLSERNIEKSLANEYPLALRSAFIPASRMVKAILEEDPYLPKAAIFVLTNPVISYPNSKATMAALQKLELIVVTELFHTPTTAIADFVLPASAGMEHEEIGYWPGWYGEVRAHPKLVDPPGEAWADTKIINELAKKLDLGDVFWDDDEEALDFWLGPSGLTYDDLKKKRTLLPRKEYNKLNFATPSGKVEIYCQRLKELNISPLPLWEELSVLPALTEEYPLLVTNPKEDVYVNTAYKQIPVLRGMRPEPVVQVNPETAQNAGIIEGDQIYIETKNGRIMQRLHLNPDLDPRVVNASFGWWFPEDPSNLYGWDRANINVLIGDDYPLDRAVGSALLRGIPCRIYKV